MSSENSVYSYRGAVLVLFRPPEQKTYIPPEDFLVEALREAKRETGSSDLPTLCRYVTTTAFTHIPEPAEQYNAFIKAMTHLGLDMFRAFQRAALKAGAKSKQYPRGGGPEAYWRGVNHGLLAALHMAQSPYTYKDDLAGAMKKAKEG